jgi:hypothetical protein
MSIGRWWNYVEQGPLLKSLSCGRMKLEFGITQNAIRAWKIVTDLSFFMVGKFTDFVRWLLSCEVFSVLFVLMMTEGSMTVSVKCLNIMYNI